MDANAFIQKVKDSISEEENDQQRPRKLPDRKNLRHKESDDEESEPRSRGMKTLGSLCRPKPQGRGKLKTEQAKKRTKPFQFRCEALGGDGLMIKVWSNLKWDAKLSKQKKVQKS
jgi:hypothetical protein